MFIKNWNKQLGTYCEVGVFTCPVSSEKPGWVQILLGWVWLNHEDLYCEASIYQQLQGMVESQLLFVGSNHFFQKPWISCIWSYVSWFYKLAWMFFSPEFIAVPDTRGPAADPSGLGLGASGGGALYGSGGLLTQQVNRLLTCIRCIVIAVFTALLPLFSLHISVFCHLSIHKHTVHVVVEFSLFQV